MLKRPFDMVSVGTWLDLKKELDKKMTRTKTRIWTFESDNNNRWGVDFQEEALEGLEHYATGPRIQRLIVKSLMNLSELEETHPYEVFYTAVMCESSQLKERLLEKSGFPFETIEIDGKECFMFKKEAFQSHIYVPAVSLAHFFRTSSFSCGLAIRLKQFYFFNQNSIFTTWEANKVLPRIK
jgi:hypothetical protein